MRFGQGDMHLGAVEEGTEVAGNGVKYLVQVIIGYVEEGAEMLYAC